MLNICSITQQEGRQALREDLVIAAQKLFTFCSVCGKKTQFVSNHKCFWLKLDPQIEIWLSLCDYHFLPICTHFRNRSSYLCKFRISTLHAPNGHSLETKHLTMINRIKCQVSVNECIGNQENKGHLEFGKWNLN